MAVSDTSVFLSEKAPLLFFGVHKDAETLQQILDAATFAGILISDDAGVYANFSRAQKCWAHLIRKAIKLTLECPDNAEYRRLADQKHRPQAEPFNSVFRTGVSFRPPWEGKL